MAVAAESHRWDHTVTLELAVGRHGFRTLPEGVTFESRHPHAADWRKRAGLPPVEAAKAKAGKRGDRDLIRAYVTASGQRQVTIPARKRTPAPGAET